MARDEARGIDIQNFAWCTCLQEKWRRFREGGGSHRLRSLMRTSLKEPSPLSALEGVSDKALIISFPSQSSSPTTVTDLKQNNESEQQGFDHPIQRSQVTQHRLTRKKQDTTQKVNGECLGVHSASLRWSTARTQHHERAHPTRVVG